jgi:hypothetical protein
LVLEDNPLTVGVENNAALYNWIRAAEDTSVLMKDGDATPFQLALEELDNEIAESKHSSTDIVLRMLHWVLKSQPSVVDTTALATTISSLSDMIDATREGARGAAERRFPYHFDQEQAQKGRSFHISANFVSTIRTIGKFTSTLNPAASSMLKSLSWAFGPLERVKRAVDQAVRDDDINVGEANKQWEERFQKKTVVDYEIDLKGSESKDKGHDRDTLAMMLVLLPLVEDVEDDEKSEPFDRVQVTITSLPEMDMADREWNPGAWWLSVFECIDVEELGEKK